MGINLLGTSPTQYMAAEDRQVRTNFGSLYGVSLVDEMNKAYEAQVRRVGALMQGYARQDPRAKRAVEAYMMGYESLNDPTIHVASTAEQKTARAIQSVINKVDKIAKLEQEPVFPDIRNRLMSRHGLWVC